MLINFYKIEVEICYLDIMHAIGLYFYLLILSSRGPSVGISAPAHAHMSELFAP